MPAFYGLNGGLVKCPKNYIGVALTSVGRWSTGTSSDRRIICSRVQAQYWTSNRNTTRSGNTNGPNERNLRCRRRRVVLALVDTGAARRHQAVSGRKGRDHPLYQAMVRRTGLYRGRNGNSAGFAWERDSSARSAH